MTRWRTFRWRAALAWWKGVVRVLNWRRDWLERRVNAWEKLEDRVSLRARVAYEVLHPPSEEVLRRRAQMRFILQRIYPPPDRRPRA